MGDPLSDQETRTLTDAFNAEADEKIERTVSGEIVLNWTDDLKKCRFKIVKKNGQEHKVLDHTLGGPVTKTSVCVTIKDSNGKKVVATFNTDEKENKEGKVAFHKTVEGLENGGTIELTVTKRKGLLVGGKLEAYVFSDSKSKPIPAGKGNVDLGQIKMIVANTKEVAGVEETEPQCAPGECETDEGTETDDICYPVETMEILP